jgi:beta-glucanase (GH16 family)
MDGHWWSESGGVGKDFHTSDRGARRRTAWLSARVVALALAAALIGAAMSLGVTSASAAAPNCGSTEIPKGAPGSTQAPSGPASTQAPKKNPKTKKTKKKTTKKKASKRKRAKKRRIARKSSADSWQCTFSDDFDGTSLDSTKWIAQRTDSSGFTSAQNACYVDTPNNISVGDGALRLTARKESSPLACNDPYGHFNTQYTSGMVSTWGGRFSQAYGRFEVRAKVSSARVKGLQSSFWLWPVNDGLYGGRPASGEIDFAELFSGYADRAVPYIHYTPAGTDPNVTNTNCIIGNPDDFHTYAVEWTPASITIIYDGRICLVDVWNPAAPLTRPQPFDQPFFICLTQGLGIGDNAFDPATTPLPATTVVDYVHVWQ